MSALFWFNCLAAIGVAIAAFTIYNKRHRTGLSTWLVFYLFATSLPWLGEFAYLAFSTATLTNQEFLKIPGPRILLPTSYSMPRYGLVPLC